jgi:5-methylcytosine-specific restriction endonuclease McrA
MTSYPKWWNPLKPYANVWWRKQRKRFLSLCENCLKNGHEVPATELDHIIPFKGSWELFSSQDNWQGLCAHCHSGYKRRLELTGKVIGCDADGVPLDNKHHWR